MRTTNYKHSGSRIASSVKVNYSQMTGQKGSLHLSRCHQGTSMTQGSQSGARTPTQALEHTLIEKYANPKHPPKEGHHRK